MSMQEAIKRIRHAQENNLTELDLSGLGLTELPIELKAIGKQITKIELAFNNIGDDGVQTLVQHCPNLLELKLGEKGKYKSGNNIAKNGALHIAQLTQLQSLDISYNNISENGALHIAQLTQLHSLDISFNNLSENGAKHIAQLTQLQTLDIRYNNLSDNGAKHIAQLTQLQTLYISENNLSENGAKHIAQLTQLHTLDISSNNLADNGAKHIAQLTKLHTLDISINNLSDNGAEYIAQLSKLQTLDISINNLSDNCAIHIAQLTQLHTLSIRLNNLSENGAKYIAQLSKLDTLIISHNYLTENGAIHIVKLSKLHTLDISFNNLSDNGARHINKLTQLNTLNISFNNLSDNAAEYITQLTKLHTLYISNNKLSDNGIKHIAQLTKLHTLDISDNNLSDNGAKNIALLTQLHTLYIRSNNLSDNGAKHVSQLTQLRTLNISSNNLSDNGAKHIAQLTQLHTLDIRSNNLSDNGAKHIAQLTQLHTLDIRYNKIRDVGLETLALSKNLQSTRRIYLSNNEPNSIPEVVAGDIDTLRLYFKQRKEETPIPNNIIRVIMCGNTESGKSSLTDKLVNIESEDIEKEDRTDGIRHVQALLPSDNNYTLNIWDFGGQDFYHATHVAALNKGKIEEEKHTLYCLLWHNTPDNQSKDPEQNMSIDYWLGFIQQMTLNPKIEIIQTHADLEPLMQFPKSKLLFSNEFNIAPSNFHHISLKKDKINNDKKCKELWDRLNTHLNQTIKLKEEEEKKESKIFPSWKDTRDTYLKELSSKGSYISRLELQNTLETKTDGKIKLNNGYFGLLLDYLRACGYILFWDEYVADAYLRENVVIDIARFHKEIYEQLLTNRDTGEFEYNEKYQLHIAYLKENGIIFQHPKKENVWIAPQFLPKESLLPHFQDLIPQTLTIRYPYYMPRYLITKFIVKAYNQYPDDKKTHYWKYGCISTTPKNSSYNTEIKYLVCIDATAQTVTIHIQDVKGKYALLKDIFNYFASFGDYSLWEEPKYTEKQNILLEGNAEREFYKELVNKKPNINGDRIEVSTNGTDFINYKNLEEAINNNLWAIKSTTGQHITINPTLQQIVTNMNTRPKKIFFSYSRQDLQYRNELEIHFANLKRQGLVDTWYDGMIEPGKPWDDAIKKELEAADIFLCLVSPYFMNNDYIWNVELKKIEERINNAEVRVIPIFITRCDFSNSIIYAYQGALNIKQILGNPDKNRDADANIDDLYWIAMEEHEPKRHNYYSQVVDQLKRILHTMP